MPALTRKFTRNWLQQQKDGFAIAYWGSSVIDLWQIIEIYAQADSEGDDPGDAVSSTFPEYSNDLEICRNASLEEIEKQVDGCPFAWVFADGMLLSCP